MDGSDLKRERVRLGVKQYKIASALGISPAALWNLENGRTRLRAGEPEAILAVIRSLAAQAPERGENRFLFAALRATGAESPATA